ncbi:hypothetical protein F5Y15DRAFT_412945 [Xylariaceae sp. FL0016]|nr:hypothetical protein F5Y15DRAFT_412945 [Xylariaceae sp. FL0016]
MASTEKRMAHSIAHFYPNYDPETGGSKVRKLGTAPSEEPVSKDGYVEFFMSSSWILLPEALGEFFDELREELATTEAIYDADLGGLRIRCHHQAESQTMACFQRIMDSVIAKELAKDSEERRIMYITDWRLRGGVTSEEKLQYEQFCFPRDVAECESRGFWSSQSEIVTTAQLLPGRVLEELQRLTSSTIVLGLDCATVYIGAETSEMIELVKRKLDTIAKYSISKPDSINEFQCFLYGESTQETHGEVNYLAHAKRERLRTYFLDRSENTNYKKLFAKGAIVSLNRLDAQSSGASRLASLESPNQAQKPALQEFKAFNGWNYRAKGISDVEHVHVETPNTTLSQSSTLHITNTYDGQPHGGPSPVNPIIESWMKKLPSYEETPSQEKVLHQQETLTETAAPYPGKVSLSQEPKNSSDAKGPEAREEPISYDSKHASRRTAPICEEESTSQHSDDISRLGRLLALDTALEKHKVEVAKLESSQPVEVSSGPGFNAEDISGAVSKNLPTKKITTANDPFASLWEASRPLSASAKAKKPEIRPRVTDSAEMLIDVSSSKLQPKVLEHDEKSTRVFNGTMSKQSAWKSTGQPQLTQDPDPEMLRAMSGELVKAMESLRIFTGQVSLKAELGRFCFTKLGIHHVQLPNSTNEPRRSPLAHIHTAINKQHTTSRDVMFTKILTTDGGDANKLSFMCIEGDKQTRMWSPQNRRTIYEFRCVARSAGGKHMFFIDVNAEDFSYSIRKAKPATNSLGVHCMKRVWDFQITLSYSQNLDELCGNFAKAFVDSLRVRPQKGSVPIMEFTIDRGYQTFVTFVRVRNIATYVHTAQATRQSNESNAFSQTLEIAEVWEMKLKTVEASPDEKLDTEVWAPFPGDAQGGWAEKWYEASILSDKISAALVQNRRLDFGDEADWSAKDFEKSGDFEELVRTATRIVKRIDEMGRWSDNYQDAMIHPEPPTSIREAPQSRKGRRDAAPAQTPVQYW